MNVAQLAEAVYLGMLGTEFLAAMGFAFPLTITLFAFAGGIGSGAYQSLPEPWVQGITNERVCW